MGIGRVWDRMDGRWGIGSLLFHCRSGLAVGRICFGSCSWQVRIDASSDLREYLCFHLIMWTILQVINSCYRPEPSHSYLYLQTCEYCLRYVCKSLRTVQVSTIAFLFYFERVGYTCCMDVLASRNSWSGNAAALNMLFARNDRYSRVYRWQNGLIDISTINS